MPVQREVFETGGPIYTADFMAGDHGPRRRGHRPSSRSASGTSARPSSGWRSATPRVRSASSEAGGSPARSPRPTSSWSPRRPPRSRLRSPRFNLFIGLFNFIPLLPARRRPHRQRAVGGRCAAASPGCAGGPTPATSTPPSCCPWRTSSQRAAGDGAGADRGGHLRAGAAAVLSAPTGGVAGFPARAGKPAPGGGSIGRQVRDSPTRSVTTHVRPQTRSARRAAS